MLNVGIHENIRIGEETSVREKGGIDIYFEVKSDVVDLYASFEDAKIISDDTTKIVLFPVNADFKGEKKTAEAIMNDLITRKYWYSDILEVYTTEENVKAALSMDKIAIGLQVNAKNLKDKITDPTVCASLSENLDKAFISALKTYNVFKSDKNMRVKFVRQSKDKHFPTLPRSRQFKFPWVESMDVAKAATKVVFTDYELTNALNNPFPVKSDDTSIEDINTAGELLETDDTINEVFPPELGK